MNKLTVTLKQHTPLIHFQHDQEGATLRASEVKPKLDKFIITKLGNGDYEKGIDKAKESKWLIGKGDHPALDYKMRIVPKDEETDQYMVVSSMPKEYVLKNINVLTDTPFFAQEKQKTEILRNPLRWNEIEKKGLLSKNNIDVVLICRNQNLIQKISDYVQAFFVTTNFGTRQSKGFGCFSIESQSLNDTVCNIIDKETLLINDFEFVYKRIVNGDLNKIFSEINKDYKLLKSGQTRPSYAKSKLMLYGRSKNICWEKRAIKQFFYNTYPTENEDVKYQLKSNGNRSFIKDDEDVKYRYLRSVLGFSEQFEFLLNNPPTSGSEKMILKFKDKEKDKDKVLERFMSPILIKVYDNCVYFVGNEVDKRILNKQIGMYITLDVWEDDEFGTINTPNDFSLIDFMRFAMTNNQGAKLNYEKLK